MYIHEYMKSPVITVTGDTLLDDALRVMHDKHIRRLPVVDKGKLVGLVTRNGLREAAPSSAIPLSIWRTHYQLSRMKVRDVMITDVVTVTPDTTVEEAAVLSEKHKVGTLPVVDAGGKLVGIVTGTDLRNIMVQALGLSKKGVRLHIIGDLKGVQQYQIMEILIKHKVNILSAFPVKPTGTRQGNFIIHLDTEDASAIVADLNKLGLDIEVRKH